MKRGKKTKARGRISQDRIDKVLAALPAAELQRIRHELKKPLAPKKRPGRPITLLTGKQFGSLTVGPRTDRKGGVFYTCLCACANLVIAEASNLRGGKITKCKSCASKHVGRNLPRVAAKLKRGS